MPSVEILIADIANKLLETYTDDPQCPQYAWWLVEALTKQKKSQLIKQTKFELTEEQENILTSWLKKITEQEIPLQYILGSVPFCDLEILVETPVLIPRQETEEWTYSLIQKLNKLHNKKINILDLCTGSGCIALALGKALPEAQIIAVDIQNHALSLASRNCRHNNICNVTIQKSDLFVSLPQTLKFDLIISNPPYIDPAEWPSLDRSVKEWEGKKALIAPEHGLHIIKRIIQQAPQYMRLNEELAEKKMPQLMLEIGYKQGNQVLILLEKHGYCNITIEKDLEGKDRVACARIFPCCYMRNL